MHIHVNKRWVKSKFHLHQKKEAKPFWPAGLYSKCRKEAGSFSGSEKYPVKYLKILGFQFVPLQITMVGSVSS